MSATVEYAPKVRRPACKGCGGTGYVYLWSVARAGTRTWFCDRCKLNWTDGGAIIPIVGAEVVAVPALQPDARAA